MKRPIIKDKDIEDYVLFLEDQLDNFKAESTRVESYLGLKKIVDDINKALKGATINLTKISDKDDKYMERVLKFADKVDEYNDKLDAMEKKINPDKLEDAKKNYGNVLEEALGEKE